jgi:hypothetical protein
MAGNAVATCSGNEADIAVLVSKTERPRLGDHGRFDKDEARKWRISSQANSLARVWLRILAVQTEADFRRARSDARLLHAVPGICSLLACPIVLLGDAARRR